MHFAEDHGGLPRSSQVKARASGNVDANRVTNGLACIFINPLQLAPYLGAAPTFDQQDIVGFAAQFREVNIGGCWPIAGSQGFQAVAQRSSCRYRWFPRPGLELVEQVVPVGLVRCFESGHEHVEAAEELPRCSFCAGGQRDRACLRHIRPYSGHEMLEATGEVLLKPAWCTHKRKETGRVRLVTGQRSELRDLLGGPLRARDADRDALLCF
jgi:hypothetical protein